MKIELKPCPFCGEEVMPVWMNDQEEYRYEGEDGETLDYFKCYGCGMETFFSTPFGDDDKITQWNERVTL